VDVTAQLWGSAERWSANPIRRARLRAAADHHPFDQVQRNGRLFRAVFIEAEMFAFLAKFQLFAIR